MNQILPEKGKKRYYTKKLPKIPLILTKKVQIAPQSQVLLECSLAKLSDQYQSCTGLVIYSDRLEDKCSIALTLSLSKIDDTGKVFVSAKTLSDNQITLNNQTEIAHFEIFNEAQADNLIEIDPQLISLATRKWHSESADPAKALGPSDILDLNPVVDISDRWFFLCLCVYTDL